MADEGRCCGGRCCDSTPVDLNRRDFIEKIAVGTAALAVIGDFAPAANAAAAEKNIVAPPIEAAANAYPKTAARVYRGEHLEAVGMPIGGIGSGSIWLDGRGALGVWQIFNNLSEPRVPDSFFAVHTRDAAGKSVTRVLQTTSEAGLTPVEALEFEGGYPIARLAYHNAALPVEISLETMNPMIPLDAANSSIPCALFRFTAKNSGKSAVEVALVAALQNAVGNGGATDVKGVKFGGYGGNRNRVLRGGQALFAPKAPQNEPVPGHTTIAMDKSPDPMVTGPVKVRDADGREVRGPEMYWIAGLPDLTPAAAEVIVRIANDGGVLLIDGVGKNFFDTVAALRTKHRDFASVAEVFEDFEKKTYEGWTITGTAFGKGPSHGTQPNQQAVTGFAGRGLVNTYIGTDEAQGTATSKPFTIKRRYIGFLIGGGNHPNQTCVNLRVGGKVVRSTTGKNQERLEPASWDVAEFKGKEAAIEIVDKNSEGWGHVNVDQIIFSDIPPEPLLQEGTALEAAAKLIELSFESAEEVPLHARTDLSVFGSSGVWKVDRFTRLQGFSDEAAPKPISGRKITIETPDGKVHPIVIQSPLRKGKLILALARGMPWNVGKSLIGAARTEGLKNGEELVPGNSSWGTMALASLDAEAIALPAWASDDEFAAFAADPKKPRAEATSKPGETINAALAAPLSLKPGESKSVTFAITWHFPNVQRFQHSGNYYSRRFRDATAVVDYLAKNLAALWDRTRQYHDTLYQSNLPEEFLDAMSSQSVILRGPTCWQSEEGYFGGFEGSYGCCPLNCTHVWNYAHTHARLFPTIGQNMRVSNFITFLHPNGETSHREHAPHNAFIDGHCACIEAALREYQLSPDRRFLEQIWPGVKKAVNWLIGAIDPNRDGMPHGLQWNTYDTAVSGQNTFIGSQYLSALAAGVRMAEVMSDAESAKQWQQVLDTGRKNQNEKLWNGEYFIQIPEPKPANDYDTGCHVDQLLGQWWAHMLGLGYLYPPKRVKGALAAVMKHNHREHFAGFKQAPRRYIPDDKGGLIICTWPRGGRPNPFILYADEAWTGIEYSTAGAMIYEGLIDDARKIVRTARSRYDGRRLDGLDSGPGGNPFNELECGKFYARAMSSWSLLIASQGLVLEGPKGIIGFKPRWQPEDHRSFFTAPESWGLFVQSRKPAEQTSRIEVRYGKLRVRELVFELPTRAQATAIATAAGQPLAVSLHQSGNEARLILKQETIVPEAAAIEVNFRWPA